MDVLDLVLVVVALAAALGGYRLGFVGRALSWLGLALGFYVAVRVLPTVMLDLASASPGVQLAVAVALLIGGAAAGQAIGLLIGARLHAALPAGPLRTADRAVGAAVGAIGVLAVLWMLLPSVASVPGWPARVTARSAVAQWMSRSFPPPPDALQVLRRLIGQDAPQVFSALAPGVATGPPPAVSPLSRAVTDAVAASTVKVEGPACGRIYEGSGFAVAPDLVMTNAHVVAGESPGTTTVLLPSGRRLPATVVMFDPRRDLALLHVTGLHEVALALHSAAVGTAGAVFGHPNGQDAVAVTPARVATEEVAVGRDLYDRSTTRRDVLVLAAALAHGDSGGPLVDGRGQVIGVAFAISADNPTTSYALSATEAEAALGEARSPGGQSSGPCLAG